MLRRVLRSTRLQCLHSELLVSSLPYLIPLDVFRLHRIRRGATCPGLGRSFKGLEPHTRMSAPGTPPRRPAKRVTSGLQPLSPTNQQAQASSSTSALSRSQSLVHHDPAIDRALQLSTFEGNYSTEDFITTLSDKLIQESKSNPGPFDPKPFLQTFSPALDQLLHLRSQVAERTKKMETEVRRAEREYGRRLRELDGGFEVCHRDHTDVLVLMRD